MFVRDELSRAVDLHRRSYNLLKWLSSALSRGFIQFNRAHEYMDQNEAAKAWIESHLLNLPLDCRPEHDELEQFARFFATYLTTSFELVEKPATQLTSGCGCYCSFCAYAVAAPNLKTKKLDRRDKERARKLKLFALKQLALECQTHFDEKHAVKLIESPETAESVSLVAYGQQLVARMRGVTEGPAVLALWRDIAWDKKGAPKKTFQLKVEDIVRAEESIANRIACAETVQ